MFHIAICHEEKKLINQIENSLILYSHKTHLPIHISLFYSSVHLHDSLQLGNNFDLIYMDTKMQPPSGIEIGLLIRKQLKNFKTELVYISKTKNIPFEIFDIRPLHCILEPIHAKTIIENLKIAMLRTDHWDESLYTYTKSAQPYTHRINEILYFESIGREIKIVTQHSEDVFYETLKELNKFFKNYHFIQIHRSYLINCKHVILHTPTEMIMSNGDVLPISFSNQKKLQQLLKLKES